MELFVAKSEEGYLRFRGGGTYELVSVAMTSVYASREECLLKIESIDPINTPKDLRMAKLDISETDWID
ncbi:hypothetical protein [Alkalibacter mobilis]|uniref:hypothetical protein n=1 Tax=Alkalibacter mobilis TaxID=2787712 RepID=UPI0018A0DB56|nr:hypothetical protein [Alkalibacter mobilis]MBF7095588.1 hypothetical protein [Alkalibacter mobilis]